MFGRRKAIFDVDAVHLPDVVAEPPVIGVVGRGKSLEYRLEILGLPVNDRDISRGRGLDLHRLPGDTEPDARGLVSLPPLASPRREHGGPVRLGLARQSGAMKPIDCIRSSKCGFRSPNDALT
jgi:hypothetical protein